MEKEKCCPKCEGTSGYEYEMTETHHMGASWGEPGEAGSSGYKIKQSLVMCLDCGHKFSYNSLKKKGLVDGQFGKMS